MSVREVTRRLRSWEAGRPIPRFETLHHALVPDDQTMVVAFVRMAGESRPWAIGWGTISDGPTIRSVPDGRMRDDVAVLCATFAEDLLAHMRVHNWTFDPVDQGAGPEELRQVWLPNGGHISMLHQLSYTYSQTKFGGDNQEILRALGRLAGWMFRDTSRRGNQHVVDASEALREAFVFPAQDARTAHSGYQLALLSTPGGREARFAAATDAERLTVSPTMDPTTDRDQLNDLVDRWQSARRVGQEDQDAADSIAQILEEEVERRWRLTETAHQLLAHSERRINAGVTALVTEAHQEFWGQHQRIELRHNDPSLGPAFVAHPETDYHGSAAASRYLLNASADEAQVGHLIHDDAELFNEAVDEGHAVRTTVVSVRDIGTGRSTVPVWVVSLPPTTRHRLRENGRVTPYGSHGHEATVTSIDPTDDALLVTLEWTGRKTKPLSMGAGLKPVETGWVGQKVAFVASDTASLTKRRSWRVWAAKDGPGAWLTHGRAPEPVEITDDSGASDLIVDDVRQIEEGATT